VFYVLAFDAEMTVEEIAIVYLPSRSTLPGRVVVLQLFRDQLLRTYAAVSRRQPSTTRPPAGLRSSANVLARLLVSAIAAASTGPTLTRASGAARH